MPGAQTSGGTTLPSTIGNRGGTDIASLLTALAGIFGSTNQTTTQQTHLDQNVLNAMLQQAMERNSGLAGLLGGQRTAGLYNSSTNNLLANDFMSRIAVDTAAKGAPTTTQVQSQPMVSPALGLGGLLLMQAMSPAGLGGMFGSKKASGAVDAATAAPQTTQAAASAVPGFMDNPIGSITGTVSNAWDNLTNALSFGGGSGANAVTSPGLLSFTRPAPADALHTPATAFVPELSDTVNDGLNFARLGSGASAIGSPVTTLDLGFADNPISAVNKLSRSGEELFGGGFDASGAFDFGSVPWTAGLSGLMQGDIGQSIGDIGKAATTSLWGSALGSMMGMPWLGAILGSLFNW